jgi:uncharacterized membrane protein YbhN (UPF0104 family)
LTIPRSFLRILRWAFVLVLVAAALWALRGELPNILAAARSTHPRWGLVAAASAITLLAYALLIESWRRVLGELGGQLRFADAALIWLGSNLARYIPGVGLQVLVMGGMAKRRRVPLAVSTAASLLTTIASILTGIATVVAGLALLAVHPGQGPVLSDRALVLAALGVAGLAATPWLLPRAGRIAARLTGRPIVMPSFSLRAVLVAGVGTATAWIAYGVSFWMLALAVLPPGSHPSLAGCITLYTASYLAGWFNPMPAGIGVTEPAMVLLGPQFGVGTTAQMTVLALFARAVRTVLEMGPSLIAMGIVSLVHRDDPGETGAGI